MADPDGLRKLAAWYREFAESAGSPWIWEARLRTAEELDAEAGRVEGLPRRSTRRSDALRLTGPHYTVECFTDDSKT